jgi:hypothetical protein
VVEGANFFFNHHWRVERQRGAIDLVCCGPNGRSATSLRPKRLRDFFAYNATVIAPCNGIVTSARNDMPDHPIAGAPAIGNHVRETQQNPISIFMQLILMPLCSSGLAT